MHFLSHCAQGDKCHRAGLQATGTHGLSSGAAPADAGLLAKRQERTAQVPRYCQHVGQNDTQPCISQSRHQQHRAWVRRDTDSFTYTNKLHSVSNLYSTKTAVMCCNASLSPLFYLQALSSSLVRPWSPRPEQGELCGRLAGSSEDDPVSRLLPGLRLHFFATRHTDHSRVGLPSIHHSLLRLSSCLPPSACV